MFFTCSTRSFETAAARFSGRAEVDALIRQRFGQIHSRLAVDPPPAEALDAQGHVSAVIVFDQFSRNLFRETDHAFAFEPLARKIAAHALSHGLDKCLELHPRQFLYLPFMHSRFPHRNDALGRVSTPAEIEFMRAWPGFK